MSRDPITALALMLAALGIEEAVPFDRCIELLGEVQEAVRCTHPRWQMQLSGNEWAALVNLAVARHGNPPAKDVT